MGKYKRFELNDPKDIRTVNMILGPIGVSIQANLLDVYVLVDLERYSAFKNRKAGRKTIVTQSLREKVFTMRSADASIRQIAKELNISTSTVSKILRSYEEIELTDQQRLDI